MIVNIDLDFFVHPIAAFCGGEQHLTDPQYRAWPERSVRCFLEKQCRLSTQAKIPGVRVRHHNEVFHYWRHPEFQRHFGNPFELVHIDAHGDFGMGESGWRYVCTELLDVDVVSRPALAAPRVTAGDYLLFAVACRLISSLTFVLHPDYGDGDLYPAHFREYDEDSGFIQLKLWTPEDIGHPGFGIPHWPKPRALEPKVPFHKVELGAFSLAQQPAVLFLAESPAFVPCEAMALADVVMEYIDPIPAMGRKGLNNAC